MPAIRVAPHDLAVGVPRLFRKEMDDPPGYRAGGHRVGGPLDDDGRRPHGVRDVAYPGVQADEGGTLGEAMELLAKHHTLYDPTCPACVFVRRWEGSE